MSQRARHILLRLGEIFGPKLKGLQNMNRATTSFLAGTIMAILSVISGSMCFNALGGQAFLYGSGAAITLVASFVFFGISIEEAK